VVTVRKGWGGWTIMNPHWQAWLCASSESEGTTTALTRADSDLPTRLRLPRPTHFRAHPQALSASAPVPPVPLSTPAT
jgi:hypothetical protein